MTFAIKAAVGARDRPANAAGEYHRQTNCASEVAPVAKRAQTFFPLERGERSGSKIRNLLIRNAPLEAGTMGSISKEG